MDEDVKPKAEPTGEHISIKVNNQDGEEVFFKIKRVTPLKKLMDNYCQRTGRQSGTVRFLFDGTRLTGTETPESLDMEEGDTIEAMIQQIGGGCRF